MLTLSGYVDLFLTFDSEQNWTKVNKMTEWTICSTIRKTDATKKSILAVYYAMLYNKSFHVSKQYRPNMVKCVNKWRHNKSINVPITLCNLLDHTTPFYIAKQLFSVCSFVNQPFEYLYYYILVHICLPCVHTSAYQDWDMSSTG